MRRRPATASAAGLLAGLLGDEVVVVERFDDPPDATLTPEEEAVVAEAVDSRRREFATVRWCARTALTRLGVEPAPILPGPGRVPRWPDGVVGSMTHCEGYRAAAVVRRSVAAAIGVDAEPRAPLPEGVLDLIALPEERRALDRLVRSHPGVAWDRLLFSAKESVYKAWFPLMGTWLDYEDCVIELHPGRGTLSGTLRVPGPVIAGARVDRFAGRWRTAGSGYLATTVLVCAAP